MKVFEHRNHVAHEAKVELVPGKFVPCLDSSQRIGVVLDALASAGLGSAVDCPPAKREDLQLIHDADYLAFLETAWSEWCAAYDPALDGTPFVWPHRNRPPRRPSTIEGKMGYYFFDGVSPVTAGMWQASIGAAGAAVAASQALIDTNAPCIAVSRPPGHHAAADLGGGTSYINHTALAAARLAKTGARVAILDVDAHHGNGTQAIFAESDKVLTISIHADPLSTIPIFLAMQMKPARVRARASTSICPWRRVPAGLPIPKPCTKPASGSRASAPTTLSSRSASTVMKETRPANWL